MVTRPSSAINEAQTRDTQQSFVSVSPRLAQDLPKRQNYDSNASTRLKPELTVYAIMALIGPCRRGCERAHTHTHTHTHTYSLSLSLLVITQHAHDQDTCSVIWPSSNYGSKFCQSPGQHELHA